MIVGYLHSPSFATTPLLAFGSFKIFVITRTLQSGLRCAQSLALAPQAADVPVISPFSATRAKSTCWRIMAASLPLACFGIYQIWPGITGLLSR